MFQQLVHDPLFPPYIYYEYLIIEIHGWDMHDLATAQFSIIL